MIPQILHQTWKSRDSLPEQMLLWQASFAAHNPGIDYRFYDDGDNRALLEETLPPLLPLYDSFPREIFRVDFIRPVYLLRHGGYYADMDFQCLAPLSSIRANGAGVVLGSMGTDNRFPHSIPNAFLASTPNQAFWLGYLADIEEAWVQRRERARVEERPEAVTGSIVLKRSAQQYVAGTAGFRAKVEDFVKRHDLPVDISQLRYDNLAVLPAHILYPLNWNDQVHGRFLRQEKAPGGGIPFSDEEARRLFPSSVAVTFWTHSWGKKEAQ